MRRQTHITYVIEEAPILQVVNVPGLVLLGSVAGFTIFLGLPLALLGVSERVKGFLNALAIGILIFLIVDVLSHAWDTTTEKVVLASQGTGSLTDALVYSVLMFGGLALGLLGLVAYEKWYMRKESAEGASPQKMSWMIGIGIGAHNLSEGLAIGQAYLGGLNGLASVLVIGFAAHNSTEGFGIMAPLTGLASKPKLSFLAKVLFVGGAPTLIGTLLGAIAYSPVAYVLFLAFAGGALIYVTMMMFNTGRRQYGGDLMMTGIFLGLCAGLLTDLIVSIGGA
jgi:zinc transporter, ZIP family